jgi:photosystem II stability/assembly factor-like uncharacterized protein
MIRSLIFPLLLALTLSACTQSKFDKGHDYRAEVLNPNWMTGEFLSKPDVFVLAGEQGSIAYSSDGYNWNPGRTPSTYTLRDIGANHTQSVLIAVGDGATVLRSTDHGKEWRPAEISLPGKMDLSGTRLNTLVYVHKDDVWLAAGTQNAILRSSDNGMTWKLVSYNTRIDQLEILQLFVENESGDVLFAAQHGTTGRTRDGGETWEINKHDLETSASFAPHVVGFHQFDDTLMAAADKGRLLISKDAGHSWKLVTLPTAGYVTDSAYDPRNSTIALTTQMGEILISEDSGDSWKAVSFNVKNWPSRDIPLLSKIVYDKKNRSYLAVGNSGLIVRSDDDGKSWFADIFKPLFNFSITSLLHDTEHNRFVIAGFGGSIVYADTLGSGSTPLDKWITARRGIDQYIRKVLHIPGSTGFIAVGALGSVWRSQDDGRSWRLIDIDYPHKNQPPHLRDIVQDPDTHDLISAGPSGSIIHSSDAGISWRAVFQGEIRKGEAFTQLLYNRKTKKYYACEVLYRSVYQSSDSGLSWRKIASIESGGRNLWHGLISETKDIFLLIGEKGAIAVSRDEGYNWEMAQTETSNDLYGAFFDAEEKIFLAVGENGVILRSENGMNWQSIESSTRSTLRRVIKDQNSGALIAFGRNGTIIRSTDGGLMWSKTKTPEYSGELREAFVDPRSGSLIVVGRDGGILRSSDSGTSWKSMESHTKQHLRSAAINPETGTMIAVGEGIIRLTDRVNQ